MSQTITVTHVIDSSVRRHCLQLMSDEQIYTRRGFYPNLTLPSNRKIKDCRCIYVVKVHTITPLTERVPSPVYIYKTLPFFQVLVYQIDDVCFASPSLSRREGGWVVPRYTNQRHLTATLNQLSVKYEFNYSTYNRSQRWQR